MPLSLPINGEGFVIREFLPSGAEPLAEIEFDPVAKRYLALPDGSRQDWIKAVKRDGIGGWIVQSEDGQIAGSASLKRAMRKGDGELRVVIGKNFWGHALGARVAKLLVHVGFADLGAKAIVAIVHPENEASLRLVRSLKFRRRGVQAAPAPSWQIGHYIYRLTRRTYNPAVHRTLRDKAAQYR